MRAELYDAGTRLLKGTHGGGSLLDVKARPGMEKGSFREIDFEYDVSNSRERIFEINRRLRTEEVLTTLAPWPLPFPARMWVDHTARYNGEIGGPVMSVYHADPYSSLYDEVPAEVTQLVNLDRKEEVRREDGRISRMQTPEEISEHVPAPTEYLRLSMENSDPGFGNLEDSGIVVMHNTDKEGGRLTLSMDYNAIFTSFDLRYPERYRVLNADGEVLARDPADVARFLEFDPEGHYRLYLRPAKWRNVMTVVAHYIYISWFEFFTTDEIFTQAYFHRGPIYPRRHDILNDEPAFTVNGVPHAYSEAMNEQWEQTQAAAKMAKMIIDAQWYTLSEAYTFSGNDPGSLVTTLYPHEADDFVLGIARVEPYGGASEEVWIQARNNEETDEPTHTPQTLNTYYVPWFVTPQAPGF